MFFKTDTARRQSNLEKGMIVVQKWLLGIAIFLTILQPCKSFSILDRRISTTLTKPLQKISPNRRKFLNIATGSFGSLLIGENVNAISLFEKEERRQLELCLVNILRVRYWSENVALKIQQKIDEGPVTSDVNKGPYLEARLGAKAALTKKVGGGANSQVYNLASFQIRGCIKDLESYYSDYYKNEMKVITKADEKGKLKVQKAFFDNAAIEIIESLAELVEFDGLDNVKDPSPRSSLTLAQYSDTKALFIKRILLEKTLPACDTILISFGREKRQFVESYVERTYSNELPKSVQQKKLGIVADSSVK